VEKREKNATCFQQEINQYEFNLFIKALLTRREPSVQTRTTSSEEPSRNMSFETKCQRMPFNVGSTMEVLDADDWRKTI